MLLNQPLPHYVASSHVLLIFQSLHLRELGKRKTDSFRPSLQDCPQKHGVSRRQVDRDMMRGIDYHSHSSLSVVGKAHKQLFIAFQSRMRMSAAYAGDHSRGFQCCQGLIRQGSQSRAQEVQKGCYCHSSPAEHGKLRSLAERGGGSLRILLRHTRG